MMGPEIVFISIFLCIFGIAYLFFSTRNKERMALIEKGADASIFVRGKRDSPVLTWKVIILNLALLLTGIGAGIIIGGVLTYNFNVHAEIAMPGTIFLMAGIGLLVGFFMTKKIDQ